MKKINNDVAEASNIKEKINVGLAVQPNYEVAGDSTLSNKKNLSV